MKHFWSDPHLGHNLMVRTRGFSSKEEHDRTLIENHNDRVAPRDEVHILGDLSWYGVEETLNILKKLHGHKYLILGNHDRLNAKIKAQFKWVKDVYELSIRDDDPRFWWNNGKFKVFMSHYAHRVWPSSHYGSFHLYGHSHGKLEDDIEKYPFSFDVSVEAHDLCPISWDRVKDIMYQRRQDPPPLIQERLKHE